MADLLTFPALPLSRQGRPIPFFDTAVQGATSGPEARVSRRGVRYRIPVTVQLREWLGEDATFFGFFEAVGGRRDSFLYVDKAGATRRCRFDTDSLDDLDWAPGGVYSGTLDLVTVI